MHLEEPGLKNSKDTVSAGRQWNSEKTLRSLGAHRSPNCGWEGLTQGIALRRRTPSPAAVLKSLEIQEGPHREAGK